MRHLFSRPAVLATALALMVTACGSDSDEPNAAAKPDSGASAIDEQVMEAFNEFGSSDLVGLTIEDLQAAKDEGSVTIYTGFVSETQVNAFKERYPFIKLEMVQLPGGQLLERFASEKRAGQNAVDVFEAPEAGMLPLIGEGFCSPYTSGADSSFRDEAKLSHEDKTVAYRQGALVYGMVFVPAKTDPALIEDMKTWEGAFTSPALKGKNLGVVTPTPGSATAFTYNSLYAHFGNSDELWRKQRDLVAGVSAYQSTTVATPALLQGEIDIAGPVTITAPADLFLAGAPIGWVTPTPHVVSPYSGCIATQPPHPAAAKVLFEFLLSEKGQTTQMPQLVTYRTDVAPDAGIPENLKEQKWYAPVDPGQILDITTEQVQKVADQAGAAWTKVYG